MGTLISLGRFLSFQTSCKMFVLAWYSFVCLIHRKDQLNLSLKLRPKTCFKKKKTIPGGHVSKNTFLFCLSEPVAAVEPTEEIEHVPEGK